MGNMKKCMVFETLGSVKDLQIQEGAADGLIRLSGVFGVCGVKNGNNRIYDKANYGKMVEALQKQIMTEGCPGELEHPNSMNIDLNNVSHKIESIEMNEDGTITGTVVLLNTHKGKDAQAMVEGGLPLFISSRGAGSIDESGHVTLSMIKTYDLVGTPGFAQAKLTLKKNQSFESLNESLEDGNIMYAIVENEEDTVTEPVVEKSDDPLADDGKKEDPKDEPKKDDDSKEDPKGDPKEDPKEDPKDEPKKDDKKDNKDSKEVTMNDLKESIDKLTERITSLEAGLHVAQESLEAKNEEINKLNEALAAKEEAITKMNEAIEAIKPTNYAGIQAWLLEEFAPEFKNEVVAEALESAQNWVVEGFAPQIEGWITEEFAPEVQNWVCEEFAPEVQNWITEEFAPEVQNWVCEEFAPEVQGWICEEFAPTVENWINKEYAPEHDAQISESIENKVNANVSAFIESQKADKYDSIDKMLEALEASKNNVTAQQAIASITNENKYAGIPVVEGMPNEYKPMWEMLSEAKKDEVIRQSRAYNFSKKGVMESFWASVKFEDNKPATTVNEGLQPTYHNSIIAQMKALRK